MIFQPIMQSVVCVGKFNPSILTPDFLSTYCLFKPTDEALGKNTPVISELSFGKIRFLLELDKFQISQNDIKEYNDCSIMDVMSQYIMVLKYTPIYTIGINLHSELHEVNHSKIVKSIDEHSKASKSFKIQLDSYRSEFMQIGGKELQLNKCELSYQFDDAIKHTLTIDVEEHHFRITSNFAVGNLNNARGRIDLLFARYGGLVENHEDIVKKIGAR